MTKRNYKKIQEKQRRKAFREQELKPKRYKRPNSVKGGR